MSHDVLVNKPVYWLSWRAVPTAQTLYLTTLLKTRKTPWDALGLFLQFLRYGVTEVETFYPFKLLIQRPGILCDMQTVQFHALCAIREQSLMRVAFWKIGAISPFNGQWAPAKKREIPWVSVLCVFSYQCYGAQSLHLLWLTTIACSKLTHRIMHASTWSCRGN